MNTKSLLFVAALAALCAQAEETLTVTADRIAADQRTGSLVASGGVNAVCRPYRLMSSGITRDADGVVELADPTTLTTCTNECGHLHWRATGGAE